MRKILQSERGFVSNGFAIVGGMVALGFGLLSVSNVNQFSMEAKSLVHSEQVNMDHQSAIAILKASLKDGSKLTVENGEFKGVGSDRLKIENGQLLVKLQGAERFKSSDIDRIFIGNDFVVDPTIVEINLVNVQGSMMDIRTISWQDKKVSMYRLPLNGYSSGLDAGLEEPGTIIFKDNFERQNTFDSSSDFHWSMMIDDKGKILKDPSNQCRDHICAKIFRADERIYSGSQKYRGPNAEGESALYFFGRSGRSIHDIFLNSKTFNLSSFNKINLDFKMLPIHIGDNDTRRGSGYVREGLSVDVCLSGADKCNGPQNRDSNSWVRIFETPQEPINSHLDGTNHTKDDWQSVSAAISLDEIAENCADCDKSHFQLRFVSRMQDGLKYDLMTQAVQDAIALDEVKLYAAEP